jgi:polar amino acid transport system permease protein
MIPQATAPGHDIGSGFETGTDEPFGRYDRRRRRRPAWVDEFPWWIVIIGLAIAWMAYLTAFVPRYNLAYDRIIEGLAVTIRATAWAFVISCLIGLLAALGRMSRSVILRNVARAYIEFIRGIPILVLIFTIALVIVPEVSDALGRSNRLSLEWRGIIALALIYGGYIAEVFRGGIQGIPRGQIEAGRSVGLTGRQTLLSIVLPQAMRTIIPPLGNDLIAILKDSSLLSVLGILEMSQISRQYASSSFQFRETYLVLTLIYLTMTIILSILLNLLERRMSRDRVGER